MQVLVPPEHLKRVRDLYAPADHPIFQLVPPSFSQHCELFYAALGSPPITRATVWDIYNGILAQFNHMSQEETNPYVNMWNQSHILGLQDQWTGDEAIPELQGTELAKASYHYEGGVNGGRGLGRSIVTGVFNG